MQNRPIITHNNTICSDKSIVFLQNMGVSLDKIIFILYNFIQNYMHAYKDNMNYH